MIKMTEKKFLSQLVKIHFKCTDFYNKTSNILVIIKMKITKKLKIWKILIKILKFCQKKILINNYLIIKVYMIKKKN